MGGLVGLSGVPGVVEWPSDLVTLLKAGHCDHGRDAGTSRPLPRKYRL